MDRAFDSDQFVGDLAMCVPDKHDLWFCSAMHNGQVTNVGWKPSASASVASPAKPVTSANAMVEVAVDVAGYPVTAMVDTGCSWPLSIPTILADALVKSGRAERTTPAKSTLADGSTHDVEVIVINQITVDGRVLQDVVAALAPGNDAPILLGLGALNRLGPYNITNGRLVFTGEQPA